MHDSPAPTPRSRGPSSRCARWGVRLVLAAAVPLAALEGVCRLAGLGGNIVYEKGLYSPLADPRVGYGLTPGYEGRSYASRVRVNSRGHRGPEVADAPAAGVYRIFCAGDSFTFGMGVEERETWPARLQTLLPPPPGFASVEVINGGVCGYNLEQLCGSARSALATLHPHGILLGLVANDLGPAFTARNGYLHVPARAVKFQIPGKRWLQTHSHLYQFLSFAYQQALTARLIRKNPAAARELMYQDTRPEAAPRMESALREFLREAGAAACPVTGALLLMHPESPIPALVERAGLKSIDLSLAPEHRLPDGHPAPLGHSGYAEQLVRGLAAPGK